MKKLIVVMGVCLLLAFNGQAHAEDLKEAEISTEQIKLSKDGTGIIKFKPCGKCKQVLVKITPATKAYLNGEVINILEAKSRFNERAVGLLYMANSNVARAIYF